MDVKSGDMDLARERPVEDACDKGMVSKTWDLVQTQQCHSSWRRKHFARCEITKHAVYGGKAGDMYQLIFIA